MQGKKKRLIIIAIFVSILLVALVIIRVRSSQLQKRQQRGEDQARKMSQNKEWQFVLQQERSNPFVLAEDAISATVLGIDKKNRTVELHVIWPPNAPWHNQRITARFGCTTQDTSTVQEGEKISVDKDPLELIKVNNNVKVFCSNKQCDEVKGPCLIR